MKVLLHACCGPCSIEPARILMQEGHDITIAYLNSNIEPESEYQKRLETLLSWAKAQGIPVIEGPYEPERWSNHVKAAWRDANASNSQVQEEKLSEARSIDACNVHEDECDARNRDDCNAHADERNGRFSRCRACYGFRFAELCQLAAEQGFDAVGTTLSVSPYQFTEAIEQALHEAAEPYPSLKVLFADYRPFYQDATTKSRELEMYRQNYCGCHWSEAEAEAQRAAKKVERKAKKEALRVAKLESLTTSDFDYDLPAELIAQDPHPERDGCKMLVMKRENGSLQDRIFRDIYDYLRPGDLLVANETRVIPARLLGYKQETGGAAEVFLLRERFDIEPKTSSSAVWEALVKPGRRLKPGAVVNFYADNIPPSAEAAQTTESLVLGDSQVSENPKATNSSPQNTPYILRAEILNWVEDAQKGERLVRLTTPLGSLDEALHLVGHTPLPPYIKNYQGDEELYQTVFSREEKSAAAPTAGLHFTPELLEALKNKGVGFETVHLEVGLDTFRVVETENPHDHQMHTEFYSVPQKTVDAINETKRKGGRVIAVGTTSVRSLESAWDAKSEQLIARDRQTTDMFIFPGYKFMVVDALITNFHVPRSTLMMLVSAFSSRDNIMKAYQHAIKRRYRLLSFGDAMFIY